MKIALVVIVLAACGGSKSKAADEPKAVGATCTQVADRMMAQMGAKTGTTKEIIATRCETDGWSLAARQCLSTMTTEADADQCAANLTDDQKAALVKDERARGADGAVGGGGGAPGGPEPTGGAPPPPPAPAPTTRGPKQKDDPCQGGEDDPCQGGERAPKKKP